MNVSFMAKWSLDHIYKCVCMCVYFKRRKIPTNHDFADVLLIEKKMINEKYKEGQK